jgi:hypothetical protein
MQSPGATDTETETASEPSTCTDPESQQQKPLRTTCLANKTILLLAFIAFGGLLLRLVL